ncbi:hypothetical protein HZQ22_15330 [Elizabethkingia anophelis]|uniref:HNH endonuclease domain-containing protein n=1 Tax=Elizabethkingia anophelis TaxID=1117645 RepID=UPI001624DB3E|nr:HNH endonuclease domain-containing protein [Elizabethkingia anophelis]MCT4006731.1 hypothetical protein [Elizabethkingia anophelis]
MPDINIQYTYSADFKKRLDAKFSCSTSSHTNWGDDDITDIRSDIREFYRKEQRGKCAYCRKDISLHSASNSQVEHIVAKSLPPHFIFESNNLCVICADCNEIKRDQEVRSEIPLITKNKDIKKYPRSSNAFKIVHPHFDCFDDHILEIDGYYLDLTTKGGHTILYCKLNRKLHKFGYDDSIIDMPQVLELMNKCMAETNGIKQMMIIRKLKKLFMLV